MPLWLRPVLTALASAGIIHSTVRLNKGKIDRFFMGLFRDLGRHKARRRRYANSSHGLMSVLLKKDDPMKDLETFDESNVASYSTLELEEFGDGKEGRPILISVFGRVYDVSKGQRFYGEGGSYSNFAGRDVTYTLSTGCRTDECVKRGYQDLSEKELEEGKRWLAFFHLHDKYNLVGKLEGDHADVLVDLLVDTDIASSGAGTPTAPIG